MVDSADLGFYGAAWRFTDFCQHLYARSVYLQLVLKSCELPGLCRSSPAIVDWVNYCVYADNLVMLVEDRLITDTVAKFKWDPKAVPFDQFDARSVGNARNARESQVYRDKFLGSISDRLSTDAVKAQALDLCQELFLADGAQSDEEDVVLQHLRQLLE